MATLPSFESFAEVYDRGQSQVVWTELVADLETPVSAMLKLAGDASNSFLLESVEGGAVRGRYSIIGLKPDLIWRCLGDKPEINRNARDNADSFEPRAGGAFSRNGEGLDLNLGGGAIRAAFELSPGAVSGAVANGRGHFVVIRLKEIVAASPDKETSDALDAELRQGFQGDLINGFEQAIRDARGVKVNRQLVDNLF